MKLLRKIAMIIVGAGALLWFLIRVIPKPSRASYPCQQAAFPLASTFVIWLVSLFSSGLMIKNIRTRIKNRKKVFSLGTVAALALLLISVVILNSHDPLWARQKNATQTVFWDNSNKLAALENNVISSFDEVAIVKASLDQVEDIDYETIRSLVRESVEMAGGLESIVTNGDKVILKPNLVVMPTDLSEQNKELSGMTTDWRVTKAVSELVREINPDGLIYIVESSSEASTREVFNYYKYTSDNLPDVDAIIPLEDSCGAFEQYDSPMLETIELDDQIRLYPDDRKPNNSPAFYMARFYKEADVLISIPVLKNHQEAIITGGIKNVAIGGTPPNIYGMAENYFGKWTKIDHSQENLHKWIHDYFLCKPVDFTIIDGLQGYDHGPVGVDGVELSDQQHNMRVIISGNKTLSVDAVCGQIMSLDPVRAPYMIYLDGHNEDFETIDSKFIRTLGTSIPEIREVFNHTSNITNSAIYSDYDAPEVSFKSAVLDQNELTISIGYDSDLCKVELEINGESINQIGVKEFESMIFVLPENLLPIETAILKASDQHFNQSVLNLDVSSIDEPILFDFALHQNYPNPFTEITNFNFTTPSEGKGKMYIVDIKGKIVEMIFDQRLEAGEHSKSWNAQNLPAGYYFCYLEFENQKEVIKLLKLQSHPR